MQKRCSDQMGFFTMLMYDFNQMVGNVIHNEIKSKVLVNAGNWRTADNVTMLDAERYSYQPNAWATSRRRIQWCLNSAP